MSGPTTAGSLPVTEKASVYHIGDLAGRSGRTGSVVGSRGLFVSTDPDAWETIARLGGRPWWRLEPEAGPGRFLDWHATSDEQRTRLATAAIDAGWVEASPVYRVAWWDDEFDQEMALDLYDASEAEVEAYERGVEVAVRDGVVPTEALRAVWEESRLGGRPSPSLVAELAAELVLETTEPTLDGIWWEDVLDTTRLSAPQGVIFPSRLERWSRERVREPRMR